MNDKVVLRKEQWEQIRQELDELYNSGDVIKVLTPSDYMDDESEIKKLFLHYAAELDYKSGGYPEPLKKIREWTIENKDIVPDWVSEGLAAAMADYEEAWFVNGFRYACALWREF